MIYVKTKIKNNVIWKINVKGHSYKSNTTDIEPLCAVVSTVVLGAINVFQNLEETKEILIQKKPGNITFINQKENKQIDIVLKTIFIQLQTISLYFKKGIRISEEKD